MRKKQSGSLILKVAAVSLLSLSAALQPAWAKRVSHSVTNHHRINRASLHYSHARRHHYAGGGHVIQCVAYAKTASDVVIRGNARDWWYKAAGVYERGSAPREGGVLNFRPIRRMPLGHVAVVRQIINSRTIMVDQSHWAQNGIAHNTPVIDVSPNNDWSAVRVALNNHSGSFGSIYPTYGFIYGHDNHNTSAPQHHQNPENARSAVMMAWAKKIQNNPNLATQLAEAPENAQPVDGLHSATSDTVSNEQNPQSGTKQKPAVRHVRSGIHHRPGVRHTSHR